MNNSFEQLMTNALKMAGQLSDFDLNIQSNFTLDIDDQLRNGGIDVGIDDIEVDLLSGILTYQGRSIIYIFLTTVFVMALSGSCVAI